MNKHAWFLDLEYEVVQALAGHYWPRIQELMAGAGWEGWDLNLAQLAQASDPEPFTLDQLLVRIPYMSPHEAGKQLAGAVERGALSASGDGYLLADDGRAFLEKLKAEVEETARELQDRAPGGTEHVVALLRRQGVRCEEAGEIDTPNLVGSRAFDPGPDALLLSRMRRYINDLFAYRDDAHVAAWRAYEVSGHEWEAFSHVWGQNVWGDRVATLDEVAEKLAFRGYDAEEYGSVLAGLCERGWLTEEEGRYEVADEGRLVREAAEEATDRYFFGPWDLTDDEAAQLRGGLEALRDALAQDGEA